MKILKSIYLNWAVLFLSIALLVFNARGQVGIPQQPILERIEFPHERFMHTGLEISALEPAFSPMSQPSILEVNAGVLSCAEIEVVGVTMYDLQSNSSIGNRMLAMTNKSIATWMLSLDNSPFDDRGTGYNLFDGSTWGEIPYERTESIRTGWPSIAHTASGREVVVSHSGIDTPLHMAWRDAGSGAWNEASISSDIEVGKLWPRMAAGGEDGNSLHVICLTTPAANGGAVHNGQDGCMLYYRSQDGGDTWDVIDHIFPELDSSNFTNFSGDAYAIHARGNTVAFAAFNSFSDSFVMISQDNGETWEKQLFVDFPVDLYVVDMGLPEGEEYAVDFNEDGLFQEYFSTDGAGAVHIDTYGQVHVSYGSMYYMDPDTTDGTTSYFPGTNGLAYWNESMGVDSVQIIGYSYDYDESGTLDFDGIAAYFVGSAGFPSIGSDAAGNLYVTYSAIMENYSTGAQNYRHQFLVRSTDGGTTWNSDSALDLTPDEDFVGFEAVFGCLAPDVVNGQLEILYQRDFEPGLHVRGDEDPADINEMIYLKLPVDVLNDSTICYTGCTDPNACNYDIDASTDDGSCTYPGCLDVSASNYNPTAGCSDECIYLTYDCSSIGNDVWSNELMGLYPVWQEAMHGVPWEGEWVFNVPATIVDPGSGVSYGVHHVDWLAMEGMPEWATATSFDTGEAMGASTQHCISAFGTPTAPGMYSITATGEVFISIFGQPFSIGEQSFSATLEVMANPNPIPGCTYPLANNYLSYATFDDGGCEYWGCTDYEAANFNPFANVDDGSCGEACDPANDSSCQADNDGDGVVAVSDLLILLGEFGSTCE